MFEKLAKKYGVANPLTEEGKGTCQVMPMENQQAASAANTSTRPNYHSILTQFYQKHNPSKVAEISKHLEKYKVRFASFGLNGNLFLIYSSHFLLDSSFPIFIQHLCVSLSFTQKIREEKQKCFLN